MIPAIKQEREFINDCEGMLSATLQLLKIYINNEEIIYNQKDWKEIENIFMDIIPLMKQLSPIERNLFREVKKLSSIAVGESTTEIKNENRSVLHIVS